MRHIDTATRVAALLLFAFIGSVLVTAMIRGLRVPSCPEDAVLVGVGQYERGRWSSYACGPAADDIITRAAHGPLNGWVSGPALAVIARAALAVGARGLRLTFNATAHAEAEGDNVTLTVEIRDGDTWHEYRRTTPRGKNHRKPIAVTYRKRQGEGTILLNPRYLLDAVAVMDSCAFAVDASERGTTLFLVSGDALAVVMGLHDQEPEPPHDGTIRPARVPDDDTEWSDEE